MEIINLDKFADSQKVSYRGKEYTITGMTVDQFINDENIAKLDDSKTTTKDKIKIMVDVLSKQSTFELDVLLAMPFSVLDALILVSQGENPNQLTKKSKTEKEKTDSKKK